MSMKLYQKPVLETKKLELELEPCGQVDIAHFYHNILPHIDVDDQNAKYQRDLNEVMKDRLE